MYLLNSKVFKIKWVSKLEVRNEAPKLLYLANAGFRLYELISVYSWQFALNNGLKLFFDFRSVLGIRVFHEDVYVVLGQEVAVSLLAMVFDNIGLIISGKDP